MQIKVPRVPKEQELQIKNLIRLLHEFNSMYLISIFRPNRDIRNINER